MGGGLLSTIMCTKVGVIYITPKLQPKALMAVFRWVTVKSRIKIADIAVKVVELEGDIASLVGLGFPLSVSSFKEAG